MKDHVEESLRVRDESAISRRCFLERCTTMLHGVAIVGVLAPLATACDTSLEPRDPSSDSTNNGGNGSGNTATFNVAGLTGDGQGMLTTKKGPDGYTVMIVRVAAGQFKGLSTRCTHQGCDVNAPSNGSIACPCHGSRFTLEGAVINGPATLPLRSYPLTYDATKETVTVTLS